MVSFESLDAVSYWPFTVTMALSCISSEIKPDIGCKSWYFFRSLLHAAPLLGGGWSRQNIPIQFSMEKTRMMKKIEDIYNRLHTIPAYGRQTDKRTDRQTDILPRHSPRYAYPSRGKNRTVFAKVMFKQRKVQLLSRVSILTRDIDIANLSVRLSVRPSVRLSVRYVPVSDENGLTYRHSFFFTVR